MKFIRYGSLSPQKAKHWSIDAGEMPAPRGIYAFPYGYLDYWYIWQGRGSDDNPRVQYLKDEAGHRLCYDELFKETSHEISPFFMKFNKTRQDMLLERIEQEEPGLPWGVKIRRCGWEMLKSPLALYLKRKYHLKAQDEIFDEPRKSWLMVLDDPDKPPRLTHNPYDETLSSEQLEAIPLDQKLHFLKGEDGKRIPATDLICPHTLWGPERYWDDFKPLAWDDVNVEDFLIEQTHKTVDSPFKRAYEKIQVLSDQNKYHESKVLERKVLEDWLASKRLRLEQLCPWPVYPEGRRKWAVIYKKPHIFEYSGCLWHHLREHVRHGEILRIVDDWCYTTIGAYEDALRHAEPMLFDRHLGVSQKNNWQGGLDNPGYSNAHVPKDCDLFEVFIDSKLVEKKQN